METTPFQPFSKAHVLTEIQSPIAGPPALAQPAPNRFNQIRPLIGNTPLLAIHFRFKGERRIVYAKAEHLNVTGSIKDRMAFHILKKAYESGSIQPGDTIVEATSGNTGIAFAAIGRALGHPVVIFIPDWLSKERIALIRSLGAKTVLVSKEEGGFLGSIRMTEELARNKSNVFLPSQFDNLANIEAHDRTTGSEIFWQLDSRSLMPDAFVAGVGTGGTIMGVGNCLRRHNPSIKLHPLEPSESPTLSTGYKTGQHRIQGVSDEFIPSILKLDEIDSVIGVSDGDAILMAQKLATSIGLGVGISSGANFLGALMVQNEMGSSAVVTTVFPDDNKKYLSTALVQDEQVKPGYLTPDVELLGYEAMRRVCHFCFED